MIKNKIFIFLLFLTNIIIIPYFEDIDKVGKIYYVCFLVLGWSFFFLFSEKLLYYSKIHFILFFLLFLSILNSFFSLNKSWAFLSIFIFFIAILTSLISLNLNLKSEKSFYFFLKVLSFLGVVLSSFGLYEFFYYIFLGKSKGHLIYNFLPPVHNFRVGGVYGQPNLFSLFLILSFIALIFIYLSEEKGVDSSPLKFIKYLPLGLIFFVFFLTQSRAGLIASILVLLSLGSYYFSSKNKLPDKSWLHIKKKRLIIIVSLFISIFLFYEVVLNSLSLDSRSLNSPGASFDVRIMLWMASILIFLDNPVWGVGFDNFRFIQCSYNIKAHGLLGFLEYESMGSTPWAHNEFLQILCESGIIFSLAVFLLIATFLFCFFKVCKVENKIISEKKFFSFLFILPFLIQSFFSWPLRHPPLLFIFFFMIGNLFQFSPVKAISLGRFSKGLGISILVFLLAGTVVFCKYEVEFGAFKNSLSNFDDLYQTRTQFDHFASNSYSEYRLLRNSSSLYVDAAVKSSDKAFAEWFLPYCEKLVSLEGSRSQWFNLAKLYLKVGLFEKSREAIQQTIDLLPSDEIPWRFLHFLNMLKASSVTGRPLEDFFPQGNEININQMDILNEQITIQ